MSAFTAGMLGAGLGVVGFMLGWVCHVQPPPRPPEAIVACGVPSGTTFMCYSLTTSSSATSGTVTSTSAGTGR